MNTGRFGWYEAITPDPDATGKFYSELFGWKVQPWEGPFPYSMFVAGETPIGGFMAPPDGSNLPSHWVASLIVDDVDKATAFAVQNGGKEMMPPDDLPGVGRISSIQDPFGAFIKLFKPSQQMDLPEKLLPNHFHWNELSVADPVKASAFYSELAGWTINEFDMGDMGTYYIGQVNENGQAGFMAFPPGVPEISAWTPYVHVENVDAVFAKAEQLGAQIVMPPMDLEGVGRFGLISDPTGATLAIATFVEMD